MRPATRKRGARPAELGHSPGPADAAACGRDPDRTREMAAAAVSSAKRSLRAELKRRLRALSAEERLRQSRLLAQKVGERDDSHRNAGPGRLQACGSAQAQTSDARTSAEGAQCSPERAQVLLWVLGCCCAQCPGAMAPWRVMGFVRERMEVGDRLMR